jgi:hypothetical protein
MSAAVILGSDSLKHNSANLEGSRTIKPWSILNNRLATISLLLRKIITPRRIIRKTKIIKIIRIIKTQHTIIKEIAGRTRTKITIRAISLRTKQIRLI